MTTRRFLLRECRQLGERVATIHNHWGDTGVESAREANEAADARGRAEWIQDMYGFPEAARKAFAAGYDRTIDFSLNSDWREQTQERKA